MTRLVDQRLVDGLRGKHGTHRDSTVGQPFGCHDQVRSHAEALRGEWRAESAEARDHLIKDQYNAVARAI
jgi:hypothetical protein